MKNLYFDTRILIDRSVTEVEEEYIEFIEKEAKHLGSIKQGAGFHYGLFFIYYTGHGRMWNGITYGIT
jgi:hypothetical protein